MTSRAGGGDLRDLSDGRVPAALALARELDEARRLAEEEHRLDRVRRRCAEEVAARYRAARRVGWSDEELAAAGLLPTATIIAGLAGGPVNRPEV